MSTIRELRCSDLLEITHMTMGQGNMGPLRELMLIMAKFPEYSLVCVSPGNRIKGFIAGYNTGKGVDRDCEINDLRFRDTDIIWMLLKAVEERAEKNPRKVFFVEVDVLSENQKLVELHKQMGYTCHKEYFDIIEGEMVNKTVFRKYLSGGDLHI
ncbi:N-terminal acetyltransferase B complex catalytic subunit NAA20-like [Papaver somniferum]|uniref:N-terminal acetyltransferase B complex catalytic subunit NAA20-like n=1 Tax=Papaver somniferum TaxID=3469 RepID=UPI000E6FB4CD|nr:N-terminal acetyltransferase B complex catalytic subunit NAA20-like [Papaver somniferum]